MRLPDDDRTHPLAEAFRAFVREPLFPCVGAKSALGKGHLRILVARDIDSGWDDLRTHPALMALAARYRGRPDLFQSLAVLFEGPRDLGEEAFERRLWERVQSLADKDAWLGHPWDGRVARDPDSTRFSLSFAGEAFFVVGLHPNASRPARRFSARALLFNLHDQFERLRASIVERDVALAGTPNPMLARYGEGSEARQYSGRTVGEGWRCPFHPRDGAATALRQEPPDLLDGGAFSVGGTVRPLPA